MLTELTNYDSEITNRLSCGTKKECFKKTRLFSTVSLFSSFSPIMCKTNGVIEIKEVLILNFEIIFPTALPETLRDQIRPFCRVSNIIFPGREKKRQLPVLIHPFKISLYCFRVFANQGKHKICIFLKYLRLTNLKRIASICPIPTISTDLCSLSE